MAYTKATLTTVWSTKRMVTKNKTLVGCNLPVLLTSVIARCWMRGMAKAWLLQRFNCKCHIDNQTLFIYKYQSYDPDGMNRNFITSGT